MAVMTTDLRHPFSSPKLFPASHWAARALCAGLAAAVLGGCDSGPTKVGATINSISVAPESAELTPGESEQLEVDLRDANGSALPGRPVFWTSSDTSVAGISSSGLLTAYRLGNARIAASAEGVSGFATVQVMLPPVASISVEPGSAVLRSLGDTIHFTAVARDANGNPLPDRPISWGVDNPGVAEISPSGIATALGNGVATVQASAEDVQGTATLSISQQVVGISVSPEEVTLLPGETAVFSALATDANGRAVPLDGRLSWSSTNTLVVRVDATGRATGISSGQATITAAMDGINGSARVVVRPPPVAQVQVSPTSIAVPVRDEVQLTVTLRDADGNVIEGPPVEWSTHNSRVATVSPAGLVITRLPGTVIITATAEEKSDSAYISVLPGAPAKIVKVSGDKQEGEDGERLDAPLVVRVLDKWDNPVAEASVEWSTKSGSLKPDTERTDADGYARAEWTLGGKGGKNRTATATLMSGSEPVAKIDFTATKRD